MVEQTAETDGRPGISAVIPTYNCVEYLPACLDSVLAQTVLPDEIIVVDDGSTDGTAEMLQRDYPQVRCIRQENAGASAARNTGIEAAQHELIAFGDSDDLWHPRRLELQREVLTNRPELALVGCMMSSFVSARGHEWGHEDICSRCVDFDFEMVFRRGGGIPIPTWLVRRDVFQRTGLLDTRLAVAEDLDILLRCLAADFSAARIVRPLYAHRRRAESLSSTNAHDHAICQHRVLLMYRRRGSGHGAPIQPDKYWSAMSVWFVRHMLSAVSHGQWDDAREIASVVLDAPRTFDIAPKAFEARALARTVLALRGTLPQRCMTSAVRTASHCTNRLRRALGSRL